MVKIRWERKSVAEKRAKEEAEKAYAAMSSQNCVAPARQTLRDLLEQRRFRLTRELDQIEKAINVLTIVPEAEDFARVVANQQLIF